MKTSRKYATATFVACALALGMSATTLAAKPSSIGVNEHEPPADVAHKEAKQSIANQPIMRAENADYEKAVKACKKLPLSERTTCISEAGNSAQLAAKAQREVGSRN